MMTELYKGFRAANVPEPEALAIVAAMDARFQTMDERQQAVVVHMASIENKSNLALGLLSAVFLMLFAPLVLQLAQTIRAMVK